jgi:hypothetical protein
MNSLITMSGKMIYSHVGFDGLYWTSISASATIIPGIDINLFPAIRIGYDV